MLLSTCLYMFVNTSSYFIIKVRKMQEKPNGRQFFEGRTKELFFPCIVTFLMIIFCFAYLFAAKCFANCRKLCYNNAGIAVVSDAHVAGQRRKHDGFIGCMGISR